MGTHPGFGELLRRYRAAAGLSQEELAERAGLSARGISDLERGARSAPYPVTVRKLAEALRLAEDERDLLLAARTRQPMTGVRPAPAPLGPPGQRLIPLSSSPLVGRERARAEIQARLADRPLVTLVGVGGVGKTRLGLAVAAEVELAEFPDGVYLVELAALSDGGQVLRAVASAIGVPEQPGAEPAQALVEALRTRRVLLLLDNCEHLIAACAELIDALLRSCAHLRILATSREGLGIAGELAWWVPPLALPEGSADLSPRSLAGVPAVRLFVERAAASQPGFVLSDQNAATVAEVCRRLDGLPLALELAAARLKVLSIDQLAVRLADRFRLLAGGSRTAPPRQQTLRAALDWSYDLLGQPEQVLFERLAVFAGGWTLEAAEVVCADGVPQAADVLPLLERLVDQSLVLAEVAPDAPAMRYRMLETVRVYAQERLAARGEQELAQAQQRHASAFLALAQRAEPHLLGPAQASWAARLETEHDNLRSALRWAVERERAGTAEPLAAALTIFWGAGGYVAEGRAWSERVLAMPQAGEASRFRASLAVAASLFALAQGDLRAVDALLAKVDDLDAKLADAPYFGASLLYVRGLLAQRRGDWAAARAALERAASLGQVAAFQGVEAMCLARLAETCLGAGDAEGAHRHASRALALAHAVGFRSATGMALVTLGTLAYQTGDLATARSRFEASVRRGQEPGYGPTWWVTYALLNLSHVAIEQGQYLSARAVLLESLSRVARARQPDHAGSSARGKRPPRGGHRSPRRGAAAGGYRRATARERRPPGVDRGARGHGALVEPRLRRAQRRGRRRRVAGGSGRPAGGSAAGRFGQPGRGRATRSDRTAGPKRPRPNLSATVGFR